MFTEGYATFCVPSASRLSSADFRTTCPCRGGYGACKTMPHQVLEETLTHIFRWRCVYSLSFFHIKLSLLGEDASALDSTLSLHEDLIGLKCFQTMCGPQAHFFPRFPSSLEELAEDAASLRVKSESWFWRPRRPYGTWKGFHRTACVWLTAYVMWSPSFQYRVQPRKSPGRSCPPLRRGIGSGSRTALRYLEEVDHASYVLLTKHVTQSTFP